MVKKKQQELEAVGICLGCEDDDSKAMYDDPRDPPLEDPADGPCLCRDCYIGALEERIDEHEQEVEWLNTELEKVKANG